MELELDDAHVPPTESANDRRRSRGYYVAYVALHSTAVRRRRRRGGACAAVGGSKRSLSLAHQTKLCSYDSNLSANTSAPRRESKTGGGFLMRTKYELFMGSPCCRAAA